MACELYRADEVGNTPQTIIYGQIKKLYLGDAIAYRDGSRLQVSSKALNPLARLGGSDYAEIGERLQAKRPA